jgi:hypothetical protein
MTKENTYKIILNFTSFKKNLEALMYITTDVLMLREQKLNNVNKTIDVLVDSETFDEDLFDKIYSENQIVFKDNDVYKHKFDFLFYNSIFINFFSLFEIYLASLGKICQTLDGNNIKIKDIKGNGTIDTIRKYFHLIFKLDSASSSENLWKEIEEFKAIRNSIVHNENKLNLNKTKNHNSIKGFKKIEEHRIKYYGTEMNFELNNIEFIADFKNICEKYSEKITRELIKNYS